VTDRHAGYLVVLDRDIREDDAEQILTALRMIRGVAEVRPILATAEMHMDRELVESRARLKVRDAVMGALYPDR
jgi:hypothetical protein